MYPTEYIDYLVHFHGDRDYFECHEILEEYWKKIDARNKSSIWVGLILLAVSCYHHRRNNFIGATRTLNKAINIFISSKKELMELGIDSQQLIKILTRRLTEMNRYKPYFSLNLPIVDDTLIKNCKDCCHFLNMEWCKQSDLSNLEIIHRHLRRDRSQVLKERLNALESRKK